MIPKVIHYCWFGRNPLPPLAIKCIESWKKYFPDYEIKEWNEDNFDIKIIPYTQEAYQSKKYAFVSDYARFWILYHYGGLYFDTDVEVIRPIDDIISKGAFMGCENEENNQRAVNPGLGLCSPSGLNIYKNILDMYADLHFINSDGSLNMKTVVAYTTELLLKKGLMNVDGIQKCADIFIYPKEFFCPIDYKSRKISITENTRTIHHFAGSWITFSDIIKIKLYKIITSNVLTKFIYNITYKSLKKSIVKYNQKKA